MLNGKRGFARDEAATVPTMGDEEAIVPVKIDPFSFVDCCGVCPCPEVLIISTVWLINGIEVFGTCERTKS